MKQLLILLLAATLVFNSCSKSKNDTNIPNCKVETIETSFEGLLRSTSNYTFDAKGRVLRIDYHEELLNTSFYKTFSYQADKIVASYASENTPPAYVRTKSFGLDSQGRLLTVGDVNFQYNSEGFLTKLASPDYSEVFEYENRNLIKVIRTDKKNLVVKTILMEYSNNLMQSAVGLVDSQINTLYLVNISDFPLVAGKASKNLVSKCTIIQTDQPNRVITCLYDKDAVGNINYLEVSSGYSPAEFEITYQCE